MSNSQNQRPGDTEHNKAPEGGQATQKNEPRRTPESRHDRESQVGGHNQSQSRQQGGGTGNGGGAGGAG